MQVHENKLIASISMMVGMAQMGTVSHNKNEYGNMLYDYRTN